MPLDLQDLSPKPDFEAMESAQSRIPKLPVRGGTKASPVVPAATPSVPIVTAPFSEKHSKESLLSSGENTLSPPSPAAAATAVTPWEKENEKKLEPRPVTACSDNFATSTNECHSCEIAKQPFRHEVHTVNFHD